MSRVFDARVCALGEGPLWHPVRKQLYWFDILGKRLLTRDEKGAQEWHFDEHVSAAGWIDQSALLIASETALFRFDLRDGRRDVLVPLEADNQITRSNDGRADPQGGFWIGTMGKSAERNAGAIYRFYRGELRKLFGDITISNAICFSPSGDQAFFTDTPTKKILSQRLDSEGWPIGMPEVFVDLGTEGLNPDGAVVDSEGNLWNAQWGAHRVACYDSNGALRKAIHFEAAQMSCPAFGGDGLETLFATSAADGVSGATDGQTFSVQLSGVTGQAEHQIKL